MTKHLTQLMVNRHVTGLNLEFRDGRSAKAAKLHSILKKERQAKAEEKTAQADVTFSESAGGDHWSERGERGRWVRVHSVPRTMDFLPHEAAKGPGSKTRLLSVRSTSGVDARGRQFKVEDDWTHSIPRHCVGKGLKWTGRTIFIVDKTHTNKFGTDQRRQRDEVNNLNAIHVPTWADTYDNSDGDDRD